jgi:hypothetical protein
MARDARFFEALHSNPSTVHFIHLARATAALVLIVAIISGRCCFAVRPRKAL